MSDPPAHELREPDILLHGAGNMTVKLAKTGSRNVASPILYFFYINEICICETTDSSVEFYISNV